MRALLILFLFISMVSSEEKSKELSLKEALKQFKAKPEQSLTALLKPQWVGTVKEVYKLDPDGIHDDDKPLHLRFTHLSVFKDFKGKDNTLSISRSYKGSVAGDEIAIYTETLASVDAIKKMKTVEDLNKAFGQQHGWTSAWGDGDKLHWTEGWTFFTLLESGKIRYLNIFAHVSSKDKNTQIDIIVVKEGLFKIADPNSQEEKAKYKTGKEIFEEEEKRKEAARTQFPEPIRSLIKAKEAPSDHDLKIYSEYINKFRQKPDPKLIQQLVTYLPSNSVSYSMMLNDLIGVESSYLDLDKIPNKKKLEILKTLIGTIKNIEEKSALKEVLVCLLKAAGGGYVEYEFQGRTSSIKLTYNKNGHETTYSSAKGPGLSGKSLMDYMNDLVSEKLVEKK